jgi:hypothetical protein
LHDIHECGDESNKRTVRKKKFHNYFPEKAIDAVWAPTKLDRVQVGVGVPVDVLIHPAYAA